LIILLTDSQAGDFPEDQVSNDPRLTMPGFGGQLGQQSALIFVQQRGENFSLHGFSSPNDKKSG
jgi:hypothetical protein